MKFTNINETKQMKSNDETGGSRRHTRDEYKPVDREHSLSVSTISSRAINDESELNVAVSTTYKRKHRMPWFHAVQSNECEHISQSSLPHAQLADNSYVGGLCLYCITYCCVINSLVQM